MVPPNGDFGYFEHQQASSNPEFWRRFRGQPTFAGKDVLDLGCGHGAMSIDIAQQGATSVLGVDLEPGLIAFATDNLERRYPHLRDTVQFAPAGIDQLGLDKRFDLVVSKDTFEHVRDMPPMLTALYRALRPGGEVWAGFSPLYFSPWGDHGGTGLRAPWAHAVLPSKLIFRAATRHNARQVTSLDEIDLNGMTPRQFRSYAIEAGFELTHIGYNRGEKRLIRILRGARRIPWLEKYATVSIYAVLRRGHSS